MKYIIAACLYLISLDAIAQQNGRLEERVESQRIGFITQRVDLSAEQAQKFWPVYNAYRKEERELQKSRAPGQKFQSMTDDEAVAFVDNLMVVEQKILDLRKGFINDIQSMLQPRQILRFLQAERAFKERLVEVLRRERDRGK